MNKGMLGMLLLFACMASQSSCVLFRKGTAKKQPAADTVAVVFPDVPDTARVDTVVIAPANVDKANLLAALTPVWQTARPFNTFSGKAKMEYEGRGQKQEFTTIFRIKKDETIWASVTALGGIVQVARVMITPDSFKLINYLEKEVTMMQLSEASKVLPAPADFATLQNLVLGGALKISGTPTDAADLGNILALQVEEDNLVQQINFNKTDTTISTLELKAKNAAGPSGVISFSDYQNIGGIRFSMWRNINVVNSGEQHTLQMNFNRADFDQAVDFPFSIPKNYKRK